MPTAHHSLCDGTSSAVSLHIAEAASPGSLKSCRGYPLRKEVNYTMRYELPVVGTEPMEVMQELHKRVRQLQDYWDGKIFGFPGTRPDLVAREAFRIFTELNPNNIGTHTRRAPTADREKGAFAGTHDLEREVIYTLATLLSDPPLDVEGEIDGYIASGGTEANYMGLWVGRNKLRTEAERKGLAGVKDKVCVIAPVSAHYSVIRACDLLGIGVGKWTECEAQCALAQKNEKAKKHIFNRNEQDKNKGGLVLAKLNENGQVDIEDVRRILDEYEKAGICSFILVATAGTTMLGAFDPIDELGKLVEEMQHRGLNVYLHVDAAFGGLVAPFLDDSYKSIPKFDFRVPQVDSITVDPHKFGLVSYPAGVFLCRKNLQKYVELYVPYIDFMADTLIGSRPGAAAAACWAELKHKGFSGFQKRAKTCIQNTHFLYEEITSIDGIEALINPVINVLGITFTDKEIERAFESYIRRGKFIVVQEWYTQDPAQCPRKVYRFVIMDHVSENDIKCFIKGLKDALPSVRAEMCASEQKEVSKYAQRAGSIMRPAYR